jgi:Predicted permease
VAAVVLLAVGAAKTGRGGVKQIREWEAFARSLFLGYFLGNLVPARWISQLFGSGKGWSVPLGALLGIPFYLNISSSLPIARAFMAQGATPGAAMAFLLVGAGTSLGAVAGMLTIVCMTFRHRHFRRRRLIELAEVEEGKAEAAERKTAACEEEKRESREQSGPSSRLLLVPWHLSPVGDKGLPTLARARGKPLRTSAETRNTQAPSSQRDGCRIFLDPRMEERRWAASASCWMYCKESSRAISCPTRPLMGSRLTI